MRSQSTVTRKGQITIPIEIRRRLGIHVGDRVEVVESSAGFEVARVSPSGKILEGSAFDQLSSDSPTRLAAGALSQYAKRNLTSDERHMAEERAIELGWTDRERRYQAQRNRDRG